MKKSRRTNEQPQQGDSIQLIETPKKVETPKAREFEAKPCSSCLEIRPYGKNYSRVYCTRGVIRYCKCDYCGHTWSQEGK